ncbi:MULTISPECIES: hypothetical protein [Glutamicibacter]|uniref:Integral membrane protein n=1 Tax=Glutamicibacter halophytocola TaxID=1933880 RepID=A0A5B8IZY8_9MICC|nr:MULTISPECIES: hypothetical protein [Glutamicibacter]ALG28489.1 hypothetical protein AOZ07_05415 [Glutamicibacter halophytocola]MBF6671067.1 hypothetical protein [Glutamicibacter sp. FBE19]NQD42527.1 hypothetical protein [Glutamicibacter halophytocola]QDY67777.1 hypothetical protein FQA45_16515 [Glutamicibacter halophytocola]UUX59950.1 hypothetical protein NUH22_04845 [Glutamicibacter halophytocola]
MFALNGFFIAGAVICALALVVAVVATAIRKHPDDWALIGAACTEVFLVVYGIAAAIRQGAGNAVQGDPWEFWGYLVTALVMPPVAFFWAISEKSRWSNAVLGASALVTFIMLFRMEQIWH